MEIINFTISKKRFIPLASFILAACFFDGGIFSASANAQGNLEEIIDDGRPKKSERPESSDPVCLKITQNYLTASGGIEAHSKMQSIKAKGVITEAGRIRDFELTETADGKRHIIYKWRDGGRNHIEVTGFDGATIWTQKLLPKADFAKVITNLEAVHFAHQFWFLHPGLRPDAKDYIYASQGSARVAGRSCYLIVAYGPDEVPSWLYFDKETFLPIRWGGLSKVADTEEYLDYKSIRFEAVSNVLYPKQIDLLVEDNQFGTVQFTSIQANVEIDPTIFQLPVYESPVLRQKPSAKE